MASVCVVMPQALLQESMVFSELCCPGITLTKDPAKGSDKEQAKKACGKKRAEVCKRTKECKPFDEHCFSAVVQEFYAFD